MIKHILKLIWNKKGSNALMILEIFLSFIVLFCALSFTLFNTSKFNEPMGLETKDRWMISLDEIWKLDSLEAANILTNLKNNLMDLEEIEEVTFTNFASPFSNSRSSNGTDLNGFHIQSILVSPDLKFKDVMNSNIIEGRWFNEDDFNAAVEPILVNKEFMDQYYPGKSMIDSTILYDDPKKIIGVVEAYRYNGEFSESEPTSFWLTSYTENTEFVVCKMKPGTPTSFEEELAKVVLSSTKKPGSIIENLEKSRKDNSRQSWLLIIAILSVCGFLCLNVAMGLFGVLMYNINKRKSEIGLRQALGANSFEIGKQFITEILILTLVSLIIGIFFAIQIPLLKVTEYPSALFYKAIIYASGIIILLVFICALFPSIQASKFTPADSLHED